MSDDDLERRLENWAIWLWSGRSIRNGAAISSIYRGGPPGRRAGPSMPLLVGEASDTDAAIRRLAPHLQDALRAHYVRLDATGRWLGTWSQALVARALGCNERTLRDRLDRARSRLRLELDAPMTRAS